MFLNVKPRSKPKLINELRVFQLHVGVMWHRNMLLVAN